MHFPTLFAGSYPPPAVGIILLCLVMRPQPPSVRLILHFGVSFHPSDWVGKLPGRVWQRLNSPAYWQSIFLKRGMTVAGQHASDRWTTETHSSSSSWSALKPCVTLALRLVPFPCSRVYVSTLRRKLLMPRVCSWQKPSVSSSLCPCLASHDNNHACLP